MRLHGSSKIKRATSMLPAKKAMICASPSSRKVSEMSFGLIQLKRCLLRAMPRVGEEISDGFNVASRDSLREIVYEASSTLDWF